ncbi:protoporphyrinogen oxidase [Symbiobacterium terraclitae]|jgi:oxygen-dependent protoporphyrinogen oxidase|uniref:protoporphyrinogen oxidase n=1 Tax=Symbiobacterium terraclitae TaxID=557451 RepID=UPI0035B4FB65
MQERILIAGGGMTGLSAAYSLLKKAQAAGRNPEIILVEKENRLGGKTQTEVVDGMIIEEGPDSVIAYKPWAVELARELGLETVGTNPRIRSTYILHKNRLEQLPVGMQVMIPTEVWPFLTTRLLTPWGKLRAGLEPFVPVRRSDEDESIGSFVGRRFGREVLENIAGPLMGGIYGGDFNAVSMKATFPRFLAMEREGGSLLLQAWRNKALKPKGPTGSAFVTVKGGLNRLVQALVARLEGRVRLLTGVSLTGLVPGPERRGYVAGLDDGQRIEADAVILALPAYASAGLVRDWLPDVASELSAIPYHHSVVAALAYNRSDVSHPLDASGFLVPVREPTVVTASTWVSSKWPHAVPEDKVLIRCFIGRGVGRDWTKEPDDLIIAHARKELERLMGLTAEPILTRVFKWRRAMPQYLVGHLDRMDRVDRLMAQAPGLYLGGAAFRGVGLPDCVREGAQAAEKAARHLGWV